MALPRICGAPPISPAVAVTFPLILVCAGFALVVARAYSGPLTLTEHMLVHFALMSLVAPIGAWLLVSFELVRRSPLVTITTATCVQAALLWVWHAPAVMDAAMLSAVVRVAMAASLLGGAILFWQAILSIQDSDRWRAILALLVTGKVYCLLAILLLFAPRPLYSLACYGGAIAPVDQLADQQFAGLVMISACPLTYVGSGVVIAARWINDLAARIPDAPPG